MSAFQPTTPDAFHTLRTCDVPAMNTELESRQASFAGANNRKYPRYPYQPAADPVVNVFHPGSKKMVRYAVSARNLSCSGFGFLHGNFVYPDTRCVVSLEKRDGQRANIPGKVAWCRLHRANVHEIGVQFAQHIEPADFLNVPDQTPGAAAPTQAIRLIGRMLYVDGAAEDRNTMRATLHALGVQPLAVATGAEAAELLKAGVAFDVVTLAEEADDPLCAVALRKLKPRCSELPMLLVGDAARREEALSAGFADVLAKPVERGGLSEVLLQHLPLADTAQKETDSELATLSTLWSDQPMRPLILRHLEELEQHVAALDASCRMNAETTTVLGLLIRIKSLSAGFGYASISRAAQEMLVVKQAGGTDDALESHCKELLKMCRRACMIRYQREAA